MISSERIPNNVDLAGNKRLQRALEHWQPAYLDWWRDMGPRGLPGPPPGLPAHRDQRRRGGLGALRLRQAARLPLGHLPGRADARPPHRLRRLQGPAGVAGGARRVPQPAAPPDRDAGRHRAGQRRAAAPARRSTARASTTCATCSRSTSRKAATCGRWSTCCTRYFGRDGRDEAEALLERRSGNDDKPRILEAFNEPIDNWLDFFMFTMFTDRDGKSQLLSLSESSLDPLSRTTRFMLTEEAHHMFVGETRHRPHRRAHVPADEGSRVLGGRPQDRRHRPAARSRSTSTSGSA